MLQDGAAGDDSLSSAAATDDGGVVVGGHSNGTYNGVASEGLVDFVAIKLGTLAKSACFVYPMRPAAAIGAATSVPRRTPSDVSTYTNYRSTRRSAGQLPNSPSLSVAAPAHTPLSPPPLCTYLLSARRGRDCGMDLAGKGSLITAWGKQTAPAAAFC